MLEKNERDSAQTNLLIYAVSKVLDEFSGTRPHDFQELVFLKGTESSNNPITSASDKVFEERDAGHRRRRHLKLHGAQP